MAKYTIDTRSYTILPCPNESHSGFGHSFLFPALVEERKGKKVDAPGLIKSCLRKSGFPYHGLESLQLHSCLFHHCLMSSHSGLDKGEDGMTRFATDEYFETLLDEELGWFKYYRQMIPYIRLDLAVKILTLLEEFCTRRHLDVTPPKKERAQMIPLLLSTLEMFFSIVCDLHSEPEVIGENHTSLNTSSNDETPSRSPPSQYHSLCKQLSDKAAKHLDILLKFLFGKEKDRASERHGKVMDENTTKYFIELSALTMLVVNPFCRATEIKDRLRQFLVGKVPPLHNPSTLKATGKDSVRSGKESHSISSGGGLNSFVSKPVCIKRLSNLTDSSSEKEHEKDVDCKKESKRIVSLENTSTLHSHGHVSIVKDSKSSISDSLTTPNVKKEIDMLFLLKCLRKNVSVKLFLDIVRYFSRGENDIHKCFYNNLTTIIDDKNHVRVGDHFMNRQTLFSQVEKLLTELTLSKKKQVINSGSVLISDDELSTLLTTLKVYPDRKQFSLSPAEEVLLTGRPLAGKNDVALLKLAAKEYMPGWCELMALGVQNSDYVKWWNLGFLDLVLEKVEYVSTESNAIQVLHVLYKLSEEEPICWEHVEKMTCLLTAMLERLPSFFQERVVLSTFVKKDAPISKGKRKAIKSPSKFSSPGFEDKNGKDWLRRLKDKEEVLKDITTLMNRLTNDNIHQLVSQVLMLCLYCKEAVLTQAIQAAIDNKGQVESVVTLLRHMPKVCNVPDSKRSHSLLMGCLGRVVSTIQLDERSEENTVKMLNLLTQGYDRLLDSSTDNSQWVNDGVVSVKELMESLIMPALDKEISRNEKLAPTSQKESSGNLCNQLPICTVLKCFASIVQSISSDKFKWLNGAIMTQALTSLCLRHWSLCGSDDDDDDGIDGSGGEECGRKSCSRAIWHDARNCLDRLMERLQADENLDSTSLDWLLDEAYHQGGLHSLVLVFPLFQQHPDFQMVPILQLFVTETAVKLSSHFILTTLLGFGQINSAICETVADFIATDDAMSLLSVTGQLLTSVVAQVLSQSSGCDIARTCYLLKSLVSRYCLGKEDVEQDLVDFMNWNTMGAASQINCLCVQYLTDGLMCLVSSQNHSQIAVSVVNYQTACQTLVERQKSSPYSITDHEEVLMYAFVHCCSLLCLPQVAAIPKSFQGIHVLAMTLLTNLTSELGKGEKQQRQKLGRERDESAYCKLEMKKRKEDGQKTWRNTKTDAGDSKSESLKDSDKEVMIEAGLNERDGKIAERVKEWMNVELLLSLRDVVMCIEDDSVGRQLENQLGKMWALVGKE